VTEKTNEWTRARELHARAKQLSDDALKAGERGIRDAGDRIAKEFLTYAVEDEHAGREESGSLHKRFDALASDVTKLRIDCETALARAHEREPDRGNHNGLSVKELGILLRAVENNVAHDRQGIDRQGSSPAVSG
jgi:hypothetical protein